MFDFKKLLLDVFEPNKDDKVTVMIDLPHGDIKDSEAWKNRRQMAEEWRQGFEKISKDIGFKVYPILKYDATGVNNAELPSRVIWGDEEASLEDVFTQSTLIVAMTEYSPTATLINRTRGNPRLRAASMPGCVREMEESAFAADYKKIAKLCTRLKDLLQPAVGGEVVFSTGHKCYFDLRFREAHEDNGMLPPGKGGSGLINFPSGEVFKVPYEGEKDGYESKTGGELPIKFDDELVVYRVDKNKIVEVIGDGPKAKEKRGYFESDPGRRNIAEFGLGCNDKAIVRGIILEDEKAGFHWAYGRTDHIGGIWGVDRFKSLPNVIHEDIIYAKGSPITVGSATLIYADGTKKNIWDGEWYIV